MKNLRISGSIVGIVLLTTCAHAEVTNTAAHQIPHSKYVALRGDVLLPSEGLWQTRSAAAVNTAAADAKVVAQLYLIPPQSAAHRQLGRRMSVALREKRTDQGRWKVRSVHAACRDFARQHNGQAPTSFEDFDKEKYRHVVQHIDDLPSDWRDVADVQQANGPMVALIPAKFVFADNQRWRVDQADRQILAVELRPYINDGKHWVLYTDGATLRVDIDEELISKHKLTIRPILDKPIDDTEDPAPTLRYTVVAVRDRQMDTAFEVTFFNLISGEETTHRWDPSRATNDASVEATLQTARQYAWQPYLQTGPAPVLRSWLRKDADSRADRPRPGDNLTMFSILGGRAAIEETLQLQDLNVAKTSQLDTVKVSELKGVEVKAHPFGEMLAGQSGGYLDLANFAPHDRMFVYVAKPSAVLPFLDAGGEFLAAAGAGLTANRLDYGLRERYLKRLGVNRQFLESAIRSGMIRDMSLVMPDLLFIDGSDITVTARLAQPQLLNGLLGLLGVRGLAEQEIVSFETSGGRAYWALRGDTLCISSHQDELQRVLDLMARGGENSLGQSAEFRYMLTQLPVEERTRLYAYFSDPFVRRLVGPQVKLAQLRRLKARAALEHLTARALKARLDGVEPADSVAALSAANYLPKNFPTASYSIDDHGIAQSASYGPMDRLRTLQEVPVERVTPAEAQEYKRYVERYSQYWRQFFDPIAIRLNDSTGGSLEMETFILPLIDSSIYNNLRTMLLTHEDDQPLEVPQLQPSPILQFSANLREEAWQRTAKDFSFFFQRYAGASPALLDDLGPSLHLAVFDADPVIALGSGDLMGAFGSNILRAGRNGMIMAPIALSLLTRPCTILVETQDAERTARFLRQSASGHFRPDADREFNVSFYQIDNRDAWVWTLDVLGVVKLRFGLEVTDKYLVIRNIPWSNNDRIVGTKTAPLHSAGVTVTPAACRLQLPGLFASAADQERRAVVRGLGRLYPLVLSGIADVDSAGEHHQRLFGFRPLHPPSGQWMWEDFQLASSQYGTALRQRQPSYDPERPFGLMQSVETIGLNMQFEDAGLRSKIVWKLRRDQIAGK